MAHKKAGGSTSLGRDSVSKRLGVKIFGGQKVSTGNVIVRQHGSKFRPGQNVRMGGDGTLYSTADGTVKFGFKKIRRFNGNLGKTRIVNVVAGALAKAAPAKSAKAKAAKPAKAKATEPTK